jgi:hypothetical protein
MTEITCHTGNANNSTDSNTFRVETQVEHAVRALSGAAAEHTVYCYYRSFVFREFDKIDSSSCFVRNLIVAETYSIAAG